MIADQVRIVLPARLIPDGQLVSKPTGTKLYTLKRELKLYGEGAKIVKENPDILFLLSEDSISIVNNETPLALTVTVEEGRDLLDEIARNEETPP